MMTMLKMMKMVIFVLHQKNLKIKMTKCQKVMRGSLTVVQAQVLQVT